MVLHDLAYRGTPSWVRLSAAIALGLLVSACDGKPRIIEPEPLPTSCNDPGGTSWSGSSTAGTWRAADGPHRLTSTVTAGALTIEAGSLICASAGAVLVADHLQVDGTSELPVVLTAADPAEPWGGIEAASVAMAHGRVEHALMGVTAGDGNITDTRFGRIHGPGIMVLVSGELSVARAAVDSACLSSCGAGRGAVTAQSGAILRVEDTDVRHSGAAGILVHRQSGLALLGGSIEGSAGIGLLFQDIPGRPTSVIEARPTRITGGATHPASVPLGALELLVPTAEAQAGWTGNASDTVYASATRPARNLTLHPGLVFVLDRDDTSQTSADTLYLMPGARVHLAAQVNLMVRRLVSAGTAAAPVTITAASGTPQIPTRLILRADQPGDSSRIEHTRMAGVRVRVGSAGAVAANAVQIDDGELHVQSAGMRLSGFHLAGSHADALAALTIAAADVAVTDCSVTGSNTDGVRVEVATDVRVNQCDIHGNAGVGLRNTAVDAVDAANNWWGDAAGPAGPAGDGVAGNVIFIPFRTQPVHPGS
jgi:hypothetical protein